MKIRLKSSEIVSVFLIIIILFSTILFHSIPEAKAQEITNSETSFGITYLSTNWHYELNHLPDTTLDRDFQLFSDNGIKSITLAIIWTYIEPSYQNYNYPALDEIKRVCEFAAKYNISVIIDFHTIMQASADTDYSWTMPNWFSPRLFNTVFLNNTVRQAWLDCLCNCTDYLEEVVNIDSWQMMNEPFRGDWACDVSVDDFVQLWIEMKSAIRVSSEKSVSIRFAEYGFRSPLHFEWDSRIYDICDYVALNYYEDENSSPENLTTSIGDIRAHAKDVVISEFGSRADDDVMQQIDTRDMVSLFKNLNIGLATAFFWRADYDSPNPTPPGYGLNLAKTTDGVSRLAFYELVSKDAHTGLLFDFGTNISQVESNYVRVTESTLYSPSLGYGWSSIEGLFSRDRDANADNLQKDFVFGSTSHVFNVDLINGFYLVTATFGDQEYSHDCINLIAENNGEVDDLNLLRGLFEELSFTVNVEDFQLNLQIFDNGGADANWVLNSLTILEAQTMPTEAVFDFGAAGSPVEAGYTKILSSTIYSASVGYGWSSADGLISRDRAAPDDLLRDFVFGSTEKVFAVDLATGDYLVTVNIGDQNFKHDLIDIYAEEVLMLNDISVGAGMFQESTFRVTVADEQLNIRLADSGGNDENWVLNALKIEPATTLQTEVFFDFGSASSPVESGYSQVSSSTLYSPFLGYGWSSITGLNSRDRQVTDYLRRDFVFSSVEKTFIVDLANGVYTVIITVGDLSFTHDNIDIYAEGALEANDISTTAGSFQVVNCVVTVEDGQLDLSILDGGGADENWVLNSLSVSDALS